MSEVLRLLDEVLIDDIKISSTPNLIISESNIGASNKYVKFKKSSKTITFCLETLQHKGFFKDIEGLKKVNDATIIACNKEKIFVLLVELKSNSPRKALKQIKCAVNDVKYILENLKIWYPDIINDNLISKIEYRGIVFSTHTNCKSRMVKSDRNAKYQEVDDFPVAFASGNTTHHLEGFFV